MGYTIVAAGDVEPAFGVFRKMRVALGASAFGINQVELPAGASGREHDEVASGQGDPGRVGHDASTRPRPACRPPAPTG